MKRREFLKKAGVCLSGLIVFPSVVFAHLKKSYKKKHFCSGCHHDRFGEFGPYCNMVFSGNRDKAEARQFCQYRETCDEYYARLKKIQALKNKGVEKNDQDNSSRRGQH